MSVLIKHKRFPEFCYDDCPCMGIHWCNLLRQITTPVLGTHEKLEGCPLVEVPPHGRLIDADKIYDYVEQLYRMSSGIEHRCERDLLDLICSMPTVIPAEEEK